MGRWSNQQYLDCESSLGFQRDEVWAGFPMGLRDAVHCGTGPSEELESNDLSPFEWLIPYSNTYIEYLK